MRAFVVVALVLARALAWEPRAPLPVATGGAACGGPIEYSSGVVMGGSSAFSLETTLLTTFYRNQTQQYDAAADAWSVVAHAEPLLRREGAAGAVLLDSGGDGFVVAGGKGATDVTSETYLWSASADQFTAEASTAGARAFGCMVGYNHTTFFDYHLFGGASDMNGEDMHSAHFVFEPGFSWATSAPMPEARAFHACTLGPIEFGVFAIIAGGILGDSPDFSTASVITHDPSDFDTPYNSSALPAVPDLPRALSGLVAATVDQSRVYVGLGFDLADLLEPIDDLYMLAPDADAWLSVPGPVFPPNSGSLSLACMFVTHGSGDRLFLAGGYFTGFDSAATSNVWELAESAPTPTPTEAEPTPTPTEPTPTPTEPTPTPTEAEPTPTPTEAEPTPTEAEPTPTPTEAEPTPTPTEAEPTPTPTEPVPTFAPADPMVQVIVAVVSAAGTLAFCSMCILIKLCLDYDARR